MNPLGIAIAGILFVVGLFVGRSTTLPVLGTQTSFENAQQPTPTAVPTPTTAEPSQIEPLPTVSPLSLPSTTPKPQLSPTQAIQQTELLVFLYPNATVLTQSNTVLTLQSRDDAAIITQWYEDTIKAQGFGSRSIAKTNSNGKIDHRMGATKNGKRVDVTIAKSPSAQNTTVTVSLTEASNNNVTIEIKNSN